MIDGFYVSYFTGSTGSSIGMFMFKDGTIVGADAGGGVYDGTYVVDETGKNLTGQITFRIHQGGQSITGASAPSGPISVDIPIVLPTEFTRHDVHTIQTPLGPVNAKFEKIREA
ncbi:hypothetical protein [Salaquimonas pukyongi]|uniref:hypothetical protein n=1 Tax=Salaquimonas pukyongi TaxID=2712698 RepID=UPI00096B99BE|nr:hypothetical protein [Salaquimonas pukyongi]